ncbi:MAG: restriction endonuclease subunit S [bacterium]|nr:restriction endonuclease subunit S [bacterium]
MIDVSPFHLAIIKNIFHKYVPKYEVRAFGSRVTWTAKDYSDLDLVILGKAKIPDKIFLNLKEAFQESNLPFRVDVLDWQRISPEFRTNIEKQYEVIQKSIEGKSNEVGILSEDWEEVGNYLEIVKSNINPSQSEKYYHYSIPAYDNNKTPEFQMGSEIKSNKTKVYSNTILVSKLNPRFNRVWEIKECDNNSICSTEFVELKFKRKDDEVLIDYFTALFNTSNFINYLTANVKGTSSSHQRVSPEDILRFNFNKISIDDKIIIGKLYSEFSLKIELNQQMNKTLEAIGQAIFKHWFIDFEFPFDFDQGRSDNNGKPYKSSGGQMVDSELGKIPKGWRVAKLGDILDNIKNPLKPGEHLKNRKYVPIDNLPMRKIGLDSYLPYIEAKSSLVAFEKDDILLGAMRVYFHRVNLSPFAGITRTTIFVLRPKNKEFLSYSLFLLSQDSTIDYANSHSKGTTMPYAVWDGSLSEMAVIIPEETIIKKFNELFYPLLEKIRDALFEQTTLSQIRDSLLPKLMSGKIRVKI